jgi:hypothetical protein
MKRAKRRGIEVASLSFLDCIACGFGAITLLLMIIKIYEPTTLELRGATLETEIAMLEAEIEQLAERARADVAAMSSVRQEIDTRRASSDALRRDLASLAASLRSSTSDAAVAERIEARLARARQELSEEMARLYGQAPPRTDASVVGGIPVDSEYVIFVIDTSGSMKEGAWPIVVEKFSEALDAYPQVKGIQVLNDMGTHMLSASAGRFIQDTPGLRRELVKLMKAWNAFSNSSPVEGIEAAVNTYYDPEKSISIYVFGDDFSGGSIKSVVDAVDRINVADASGKRRVRIHAIGFPVLFELERSEASARRFAHLMRTLCERNGGTFVALPNLRTTEAPPPRRASAPSP